MTTSAPITVSRSPGFVPRDTISYENALYAQDDWRLNPKLTVNYGLRWDLLTPYYEKNNAVSSFDPAKHAVVLGTPVDKLVKLGYTFPSIVNRLTAMGMTFETYDQAGLTLRDHNGHHDRA